MPTLLRIPSILAPTSIVRSLVRRRLCRRLRSNGSNSYEPSFLAFLVEGFEEDVKVHVDHTAEEVVLCEFELG